MSKPLVLKASFAVLFLVLVTCSPISVAAFSGRGGGGFHGGGGGGFHGGGGSFHGGGSFYGGGGRYAGTYHGGNYGGGYWHGGGGYWHGGGGYWHGGGWRGGYWGYPGWSFSIGFNWGPFYAGWGYPYSYGYAPYYYPYYYPYPVPYPYPYYVPANPPAATAPQGQSSGAASYVQPDEGYTSSSYSGDAASSYSQQQQSVPVPRTPASNSLTIREASYTSTPSHSTASNAQRSTLSTRNLRPEVQNVIRALQGMPPQARERQIASGRYSNLTPSELEFVKYAAGVPSGVK